MPLYEYRCPANHRAEVFHRVSEAPEVRCDVCGALAERVMSPPMIHTQYYFSPQVRAAGKRRQSDADRAPEPTG